MPNLCSKRSQKHSTKDQAQVLRKRINALRSETRRLIGKEDCNHGRIHDVQCVVEHGDDKARDEWRSELPAMVAGEDARGRQGLFQRGKRLPQGEADHAGEAGDEGADDHGVGGGACGGVDDAGEDEGGADGEEEGADVVELAEGLLGGEAARVGGRVVVEVEAGKGEDGCDGGAVEEPSPLKGVRDVVHVGW